MLHIFFQKSSNDGRNGVMQSIPPRQQTILKLANTGHVGRL